MSTMYVNRVNNYTSEVVIDDKKFVLKDRAISRKMRQDAVQKNRRKLGNFLRGVAIIIGAFAMLYILGIAGHSDFCVEAGIVDEWTTMDYILRTVISFAVIGICMKISDFGITLRGYYYDWTPEV